VDSKAGMADQGGVVAAASPTRPAEPEALVGREHPAGLGAPEDLAGAPGTVAT
jgi:hypothetical protein